MKNVFLLIVSLLLLSCNEHHPADDFQRGRMHLDKAVEFIKANYSSLLASECTEKSGVIITYLSVNERNCYPALKQELSSLLNDKLYRSIDVQSQDNMLFELDFIPTNSSKTETTKFFLYWEEDELPDQYQKWVGMKEKLARNWWYLEYTNSQF